MVFDHRMECMNELIIYWIISPLFIVQRFNVISKTLKVATSLVEEHGGFGRTGCMKADQSLGPLYY